MMGNAIAHSLHSLIPMTMFHSFPVLTERIKPLVISAPRYGDDPEKVIHSNLTRSGA